MPGEDINVNLCVTRRLIDRVKVSRHTRHKLGYFGDGFSTVFPVGILASTDRTLSDADNGIKTK